MPGLNKFPLLGLNIAHRRRKIPPVDPSYSVWVARVNVHTAWRVGRLDLHTHPRGWLRRQPLMPDTDPNVRPHPGADSPTTVPQSHFSPAHPKRQPLVPKPS
jgi:hypothetical protein